MNGFLHCALCFTKSNISQAYTHTHPSVLACSYSVVVYKLYILYMAGSGRDHSSFKTFQVHDRNPTRSCSGTEDTLARSPRALRKIPASNPFLGGTLTRRPAHTHRRQTNDEDDEVATACSSVAGAELLLLLQYYYTCIYDIILLLLS